MKALTYFLDLDEPLLASQPFAGEANSAVSYPFVPGSMIRGAVVRLYLRRHPQEDLAGADEAQRLFFDGTVRYLHAYPALRGGSRPGDQRGLPTPRSWVLHKEELDSGAPAIYDLALELRKDADLKSLRRHAPFTQVETDTAYLLDPPRQILVHNASTDRNAKQQGSSQVYRYEALAPGQTLAGVILAEQEKDLERIKSWLQEAQTIYLGGSHTGGYGCATLRELTIADWPGEVANVPDQVAGCVVVTLLSQVLLRGGGDAAQRLAVTLGFAPEVLEDSAYRAHYDLELVGGFNQKWGLPLAQDWALAAGSVFRFPAAAADRARLATAVAQGVGARRAEGFGRLALNWQTEAQLQGAEPDESGPLPQRQLAPRSQELARRMATSRLRGLLEERLVQIIRDAEGTGLRDLPSPSQLSRVRLAARHTLLGTDGNPIQAHIDSLSGARAEWESARVGQEPLLNWISRVSDLDEDAFAELFQLGPLPTIAGQQASTDRALRQTYGARLVDGVMKVAIARQKEGS